MRSSLPTLASLLLLFFSCLSIALAHSIESTHDGNTRVIPSKILIKGGTIVNHDREFKSDVLIIDDKIAQISPTITLTDDINLKIIDATDRYVMPGGIDPHVHLELQFMGTVSKDDFYHGTRAALSGGTTTIMDFAIPAKGQSYIDIVNEYKNKGKKACSDYALHVGIIDYNEKVGEEMEQLVKYHGINSFKMFLAYKGVFQVNDEELFKAMKKAKELGAITQVHAENGDLVVQGQNEMIAKGVTGPEGHPQSRPSNIEAEAVHRASEIAFAAGNAPLYIVHVMSKAAMEEVARAKAKGYRIVGEPIAAGLSLDESVYYEGDWMQRAKYVMSPPIRTKQDQEALVKGLKARILDLTGTDHCVFDSEQKKMGLNDFRKIPNGVNGIEDRMTVLFDRLVVTGELSPSDYVRVTSTEAAQIFNIYPKKGTIQVGSEADIILLNPNRKKTISAKTHHQNIDYNVYEGREVTGVVEVTISRGVVVWENDELKVESGHGQFVATPPFGKMFNGLEKENHEPRKVEV
ncbi:hypothetical protein ABK040_000035 [Willaertia magna]